MKGETYGRKVNVCWMVTNYQVMLSILYIYVYSPITEKLVLSSSYRDDIIRNLFNFYKFLSTW